MSHLRIWWRHHAHVHVWRHAHFGFGALFARLQDILKELQLKTELTTITLQHMCDTDSPGARLLLVRKVQATESKSLLNAVAVLVNERVVDDPAYKHMAGTADALSQIYNIMGIANCTSFRLTAQTCMLKP